MSLPTEIADAVKTELNGHAFSQTFTAERIFLPRFELPEMSELKVSVVPRGIKIEREDRSHNRHDVQIDVAVQKKIDPEADAEIEALLDLCEEIGNFFRLRPLAEYPSAMWIKTAHAPIYSPEHLEELHQFTGLLSFTWRTIK